MKLNISKLQISLSVLPLFFPSHYLIYILCIPTIIILDLLKEKKIKYKVITIFIICLIITTIFFFRSISFINKVDFSYLKITLIILILAFLYNRSSKLSYEFNYLKKTLEIFSIFNLLIVILQLFLPNLGIWSYFAESTPHYDALINGRPFGIAGNPTHSGYITMLTGLSLLVLKSSPMYFLASSIALILIINKMTLIVFFLIGILLYISLVKNISKKFLITIIGALIFIGIFTTFIYPYIERWAEVDFETHTITYRMSVYTLIHNEILSGNFLIFGDDILYNKLSTDAFDSLPALLIFKGGFFALFIVYFYMFICSVRSLQSFYYYTAVALPTITMVGFYNTAYTFSVLFLQFMTVRYLDYANIRKEY